MDALDPVPTPNRSVEICPSAFQSKHRLSSLHFLGACHFQGTRLRTYPVSPMDASAMIEATATIGPTAGSAASLFAQLNKEPRKTYIEGIRASWMINAPRMTYIGAAPAHGIQAMPAATKHAVACIPRTTASAFTAARALERAPAQAAGDPGARQNELFKAIATPIAAIAAIIPAAAAIRRASLIVHI